MTSIIQLLSIILIATGVIFNSLTISEIKESKLGAPSNNAIIGTSTFQTIFANGTATSTISSASTTLAGSLNVIGTTKLYGGFNASSTATSTFANGIQLYGGCFRDISGNCISSAIADSFSTTSANYWDTTVFRWATTSTDYWLTLNQGLAFSTTSSNTWFTTKTTDNLTQGSTNLYWSNTLFDNRLSATTTLAQLVLTKSQISDFGTYEAPLTFGNMLTRSVNTISGSTTPTFGVLTATGTMNLPTLGTAAGSFIAVNPSGVIIATTSPSGGGVTIGNAVTGGTANRVLYEDSSNLVAESSNLFFDGTNLGIGTTTPNSLLGVNEFIDFHPDNYTTKIGYQAGKNTVSGALRSVFVGYQAGLSNATLSTGAADNNTGIGFYALNALTSGANNTALGQAAGQKNTSGSRNTSVGGNALVETLTATDNTAVGYYALNLADGNFNTALGSYALQGISTSDTNNVGIGYYAGSYETGSNAFYVDAYNRTNTAGDKAKALLYGTFNSDATTQTLKTNSAFTVSQALTVNGTGNSSFVGNLGIGTTTPGSLLSVHGNALIAGTTTTGTLIATSSIIVRGTATSTFEGGIDVSTGCLAIRGTCVLSEGATGITSLNGLGGASQTFSSNSLLTISSSGTDHHFNASTSPSFGTIYATSSIVMPDGYSLTKGLLSVSSEILNATGTQVKSIRGFKDAVTIRQVDAVLDCQKYCGVVSVGETVTPTVRASSTAYVFGTSLTYSLTLPTLETNEVITVFSYTLNPILEPFSKLTINGVDMTPGGGGTFSPTTPVGFWSYFVATSSGQHNIVSTWGGSISTHFSSAIAISGVNTSGNPASASSTKGFAASTAPNFQVSGTTDELLLNNMFLYDNVQISTMGTSQTYFSKFVNADTRSNNLISKTATTTGESSMSYTTSINDSVYGFILSIKSASSPSLLKPGVLFNLRHGTDRTASTTATSLFSNNVSLTSSTTLTSWTSFNDATLGAGESLWAVVNSASNTPMHIPLDIYYSND